MGVRHVHHRLTEPFDLAAGGFARFPGDIPHRRVRLSERVVARMVTTLPRRRQISPAVLQGGPCA
ncbi:hypothetical protein SAMN05216533_7544 [Streptomyces sp. Ag109_O5-10]|nr:hypothetical protein SAMN05216533_7544 [Streptomyces sp. Ag109_O5-10]